MIKRLNFVFILFTFCASAQIKEVSYAFNTNYGTSITPSAGNGSGQHVGLGMTYMSDNLLGIENNQVLGLKLGLDYDRYDFGQMAPDNATNFVRGSVELVCNISNVITPERFRLNDSFNMITHAGLGIGVNMPTTVSNGTSLDSDDSAIKKSGVTDKLGHIILGLSPTYAFTKSISINIDGSAILNFRQELNSDGKNRDGSKANAMYTLGAGLIYRIL